MKKLIPSLLFAISIVAASCGGKLTDIQLGMSEQEVKDKMGNPNQTSSSSGFSATNGDTTEASSSAEWSYAGKGKIYFEDGKVSKIEKE